MYEGEGRKERVERGRDWGRGRRKKERGESVRGGGDVHAGGRERETTMVATRGGVIEFVRVVVALTNDPCD